MVVNHVVSAQREALVRAARDVVKEHPGVEGKVVLVALTRKGCEYCEMLKKNVLPVVEKKEGEGMVVVEATAVNEIPSPSIVVIGKRVGAMAGLRTVEEVEQAVGWGRGEAGEGDGLVEGKPWREAPKGRAP